MPAWPVPAIDHVERLNSTPSRDQHAKDHNDLERAVNAALLVLGAAPFGASDTLTAELVRLQTQLAAARQLAAAAAVSAQQALSQIAALPPVLPPVLPPPHYVYFQRASADMWVVQHNLGYDPLVAVVRDDGVGAVSLILGFDITYADDHNSITLKFSQAITGRALLSN